MRLAGAEDRHRPAVRKPTRDPAVPRDCGGDQREAAFRDTRQELRVCVVRTARAVDEGHGDQLAPTGVLRLGHGGEDLCARRKIERLVVAQDRLLQLLELRAGLDSELVDERQPRSPVGLERVRLTAGAVESQHQVRAQRLPVRMLLDERLERRHERGVVAERQLYEDHVLLHRQPQLLELVDRRARGSVKLELGETVTPPERKRLAQAHPRHRGVFAKHGAAALVDEAREQGCIELARLELRNVPGRLGQERAGAERLAQLRNVHLQGVRSRLRRRLAPQVVDQPLHREDLAREQEQRCEQRPLLRAPERDGAAVEARLQRSEDQELGVLSKRAHPAVSGA